MFVISIQTFIKKICLRRLMPRKKKQEQAVEPSSEPEELEETKETEYNNNYLTEGSDYSHTIKIPKDMIAVLIGVKGRDKHDLEDWSGSKIDVDSTEGDVVITGKDALKLFELREIIQAIARGFSPETARLLLKPDYMLEIINLKDYGLDKPNKLARVKARVIGT
jgi:ribosomal RNA assembly protein